MDGRALSRILCRGEERGDGSTFPRPFEFLSALWRVGVERSVRLSVPGWGGVEPFGSLPEACRVGVDSFVLLPMACRDCVRSSVLSSTHCRDVAGPSGAFVGSGAALDERDWLLDAAETRGRWTTMGEFCAIFVGDGFDSASSAETTASSLASLASLAALGPVRSMTSPARCPEKLRGHIRLSNRKEFILATTH